MLKKHLRSSRSGHLDAESITLMGESLDPERQEKNALENRAYCSIVRKPKEVMI
jgi:hypothetical protein